MTKRNAYIAIVLVALAIFGPWAYLLWIAEGGGWAKAGYAAWFVGLQCSFLSIAVWLLNKDTKPLYR